MPQSLSRVLIHLVFSTSGRRKAISAEVQPSLHAYLATVLNSEGCLPVQVGGVDDHVHLLFSMSRTRTIAQVVEKLKTSSSKWMKQFVGEFSWQGGYGAFSVSDSLEKEVAAYIRNQPEHHRSTSFEDELLRLLTQNSIPYDERYLWD